MRLPPRNSAGAKPAKEMKCVARANREACKRRAITADRLALRVCSSPQRLGPRPKLLWLQQGEHERIPEPLFVTVRTPFVLYLESAFLKAGIRLRGPDTYRIDNF